MSIPIHFISAIIRQDDIEPHFPGGLQHFLDLFPYAVADPVALPELLQKPGFMHRRSLCRSSVRHSTLDALKAR